MPEIRARLVCQGCGREVAADEALPFRCPGQTAGDDIDHLLQVVWSGPTPESDGTQSNPFLAFRKRSYAHAIWMERGKSDGQYVELVRELDEHIAKIAGHGFRITPWCESEDLGVRFKDETQNVGGSHKARHLFGLAIWIEVAERTGLLEPGTVGGDARPLAIASCGNAALAAAVVARAWGRKLRVFIPTWADDAVVQQLREHGAEIVVCERTPDSPPGDPCFHAFRASVASGAVPFTCQGTENGLTIDGGMTLGFELAQALQAPAAEPLDHLFLQVGGGALASSTIQALELALDKGQPLPAIHAVQTAGCPPLALAWRALTRDLKVALHASEQEHFAGDDPGLAAWLQTKADDPITAEFFEQAIRIRSRYMRPVDSPASSVASGILDDETYDWFVIARAMITSGGWPVIVNEDDLVAARDAARAATSVNVDATGAAGLAGVLVARRALQLSNDESVGVLFTGVQR